MTAAVADQSDRLRKALLALGALSAGGAVAELTMERHWDGFIQLIPWVAVGAVFLSIALVWLAPNRRTILLARLLAVLVAAATLFGIYEHIDENHKAGALDFRYANTWESMSSASQWWKAATKTVGPAPVLAPGVLVEAALCVVAASWGRR
ncbi:MAG: hypothetical protein U0837_07550 [Dehalococcoidia bacterium]|jgi:hypothetical protein